MNGNQNSPTRILLVDDIPQNLLAIEVALRDCNYELHSVTSGAEAVRLAAIYEYAVILLDVQMPDMDGFETAAEIRKEKKSQSTPIIFVTAIHRDEHYENLGYIAGAVDYIFKPISVDILKAKLAVFSDLFQKTVEIERISREKLEQAEQLKIAALEHQEHMMLMEAIKARDEFLSMAAHELKTPITPLNLQMQAFINMFRDGSIHKVENERILRMLETSQSQVDRLSRLINDLVDISRIKSGKLELNREMIDLRDIVTDVLPAFCESAKNVECEVILNATEKVVGFWDKFRIEQVFINLLTNALKYGSGKPVEISVSRSSSSGFMFVSDQGIGIDPSNHQRIFERFERAVSPMNYGGLGIGLFIVNQIAQLHGGSVKVESRLGKGSTFAVELPIHPMN